MANSNERRFRGRKLILHWGKLKLEISKLPYLDDKDKLVFDMFESDVLLANVYETPDGHLEDEILGKPAGYQGDGENIVGYKIQYYVIDDEFWKTIGEANSSGSMKDKEG